MLPHRWVGELRLPFWEHFVVGVHAQTFVVNTTQCYGIVWYGWCCMPQLYQLLLEREVFNMLLCHLCSTCTDYFHYAKEAITWYCQINNFCCQQIQMGHKERHRWAHEEYITCTAVCQRYILGWSDVEQLKKSSP